MKQFFLFAVAALMMTACSNEDNNVESSSFGMQSASADYAACSLPVQTVSGDITAANGNDHWTSDKVWEIEGIVNVIAGETLTIDPGTYIKAKDLGASTPSGVLVVQKGGKLMAVGTSTAPIVFTSYKLLDCNEFNTPAPGDFGGVIMLGDAPTNMPTSTTIEGLTGSQYSYGGSNPTHNGGTLQYVRIEFGGFDLLAPNSGNEINGLTLGGVGSGTTLDHIQVSYGKDDAFEFFGGTVNASNLIAFAQDDDGFDFDHGYTGTITCALALADFNSTHSTSGGFPDSNAIELDGENTGNTGSHVTHPTINNLTIIGVSTSANATVYENGIHVRKSGKLTLDNAVVTGYPQGVAVESPSTVADLTFTNVGVFGFNQATATVAGTPPVYTAVTIPGVTIATTVNPTVWGMSQPFFNNGTVNLGARNCGNFFGTWTKYSNF